jgi:hypothetical protein
MCFQRGRRQLRRGRRKPRTTMPQTDAEPVETMPFIPCALSPRLGACRLVGSPNPICVARWSVRGSPTRWCSTCAARRAGKAISARLDSGNKGRLLSLALRVSKPCRPHSPSRCWPHQMPRHWDRRPRERCQGLRHRWLAAWSRCCCSYS